MKTLLNKVLEVIVILLSIFILGLLIPMLTSLLIVSLSNTHFDECIHSGPFWIFTLIGWIVAGCYINDVITDV